MTPQATPSPRLILQSVCKRYDSPAGPVEVLRGVSLELEPGHSAAIVGPSGSGKSTLLNIIGSLDKPTAGDVKLGDVDIPALEGDALARFRRERVGFVFQDHHLLPQCSAVENVMLPAAAAGRGADAYDAARALLDRMGLSDRADARPARLSGGERQRVAIARALINQPPLLLCDEPTGNLDRDTGRRIADLFLELIEEQGVMLILVTHDHELARRFDRVFELQEGRLEPWEAQS